MISRRSGSALAARSVESRSRSDAAARRREVKTPATPAPTAAAAASGAPRSRNRTRGKASAPAAGGGSAQDELLGAVGLPKGDRGLRQRRSGGRQGGLSGGGERRLQGLPGALLARRGARAARRHQCARRVSPVVHDSARLRAGDRRLRALCRQPRQPHRSRVVSCSKSAGSSPTRQA